MKKQIIFLLFSIYFFAFSYEVGPTINHKLAGQTGDLGFGATLAVGTGSPTYVWRQYNEDLTFTLNDVTLMEIGSERGNAQGNIETSGTPLRVSAPSGMSIRISDPRLSNAKGPGFERLELKKNGNTELGVHIVLGRTSGRLMQLARVSGDLVVGIPWSVPDGTYTLSTEFSGNLTIVNDNGNFGSISGNQRSPTNTFDLITYLQLNIPTKMNFGRVVFMPGVKPIKKMGNISILGGQRQNIKLSLGESKVFMKRVGGNETVPLFLSLTDGHTNSINEMNLTLDASGRKDLQFEARIEPGLYPDVPEGKYSGIAKFQVRYN